MSEKEKKNHRIGLITSIGIHAAVVILFLLLMAWRAPNPPFPEYGIELNFGLDSEGYGEVQPETLPSESEQAEEQQEVQENKEQQEETPEVINPEETTAVTEQPVSKTESPVTVTEKKPEVKPTPKVEEKPKESKPVEQVKKEEKILAAYPSETKKEEGKTTANHGDDPATVGDKGSKEGTLDASALYGKQGGGGGGPALDLAGWDWDNIPNPAISNAETNGKVVFEIKVDANGEVTGIRVIERSLSIDAEKACRDAISKLTFTKKPGAVVPDISTGKITFVVRTR